MKRLLVIFAIALTLGLTANTASPWWSIDIDGDAIIIDKKTNGVVDYGPYPAAIWPADSYYWDNYLVTDEEDESEEDDYYWF